MPRTVSTSFGLGDTNVGAVTRCTVINSMFVHVGTEMATGGRVFNDGRI